MQPEESKIVQARITHSKAVGDYLRAWDGQNSKAIIALWDEVKRTRAAVLRLVKSDSLKPRE